MSNFTNGDKVTLTHASFAGQVCTFVELIYAGEAAVVRHGDGKPRIINLRYLRAATEQEIAENN